MNTNVVTFDAYILPTLLTVGFIISMYLAGRIAQRRGRSFKIWAGIAAIIGPLALPLVFLFRTCTARTATMPTGPKLKRAVFDGQFRKYPDLRSVLIVGRRPY